MEQPESRQHRATELRAARSRRTPSSPEHEDPLPLPVLQRPEDLRPGEFLTGGEAWAAHRSSGIDGSTFGVWGTEQFGPAEIRGNAVRDLASLNPLPWDELMDRIGAVDAPESLYTSVPELQVSETLVRRGEPGSASPFRTVSEQGRAGTY